MNRGESVILIGHPGTGKTHLATAMGIAACGQGKKVRFHRVTELITQLMEAREERQLMRMKAQLAKLDLLILDELGYVPASKLGSELLFDVISAAYERTEVLGSQRLTCAVLDRLTHLSLLIISSAFAGKELRDLPPGMRVLGRVTRNTRVRHRS